MILSISVLVETLAISVLALMLSFLTCCAVGVAVKMLALAQRDIMMNEIIKSLKRIPKNVLEIKMINYFMQSYENFPMQQKKNLSEC